MNFKIHILFQIGIAALFFILPATSDAKKIKIVKEFKGSVTTDILGTSKGIPPYVKLLRSRDALKYLLREFQQIRNYSGRGKIRLLEKELKRIRYDKYMLLAVMTQPVDNYVLKISKVSLNKKNKRMELFVSYDHKNKFYNIPPKKSIYYHMVVVKKSDLPVMLHLNKLSNAKKKERPPKPVKVTGRLLYWKYSDLQLVPVKVRRRKSIIYYIKGSQTKRLEKYLGRVITLKGVLDRDQDSPYEKDILVDKVLKVHEKL